MGSKGNLTGIPITIRTSQRFVCGYSLVVKLQPSKLAMRVRFPLPAPPSLKLRWTGPPSSINASMGICEHWENLRRWPSEASAKEGISSMYYTYILESQSHPGTLYVGSTSDLRKRISGHNQGHQRSTREACPWKLRWYCAFPCKVQAVAFEKYLKSGSGHAFRKKHGL